MARWAELEAAAPGIALPARALIERHRFMLAGTIRRDGTPRISPVETHIVRGHLMVVMIAGTLKARDVARDPRIVLNAPVVDPSAPVEELKLRGRAVPVGDPEQREATSAAIEAASGWRPKPEWHFLSIELEDAAYIAWNAGVMEMTRWTPEAGVQRTTRPVAVLE